MLAAGHDDPFAYMPFIWRPELCQHAVRAFHDGGGGRGRDRRDLAPLPRRHVALRAVHHVQPSRCACAPSERRDRWRAGRRRGRLSGAALVRGAAACVLRVRSAASPGPSWPRIWRRWARSSARHSPGPTKKLEIVERLNPVGMRFRSLRHVRRQSVDVEQRARLPQSPWSCRCATKPAMSRLWSPRSPRALQGRAFEIVYVNDGSSDATEQELRGLMAQHPWLRQVRHEKSCGQSAAVRTGVAAARAPIVGHARRRRAERSGFHSRAGRCA